MKNISLFFFFFFFITTFSQEKKSFSNKSTYLQLDYFYGNILAQKGVEHLVTGHPKGFLFSWNQRTFGKNLWEQYFNYPEFGFSFGYQDFENKSLGKLYAVYGHYNYNFFNPRLKNKFVFSFGIGLAYSTNPYDKVTNNKNVSLGTHLNLSSYMKLLYQREHLIKNIGVQAGLVFIHASNASFKSPNKGVNTLGINLGVNYDLNKKKQVYTSTVDHKNYKEPIHFNASLYTGVNESDVISTGIKPFMVLSFFVDKRLNRKRALQFGTELDLQYYLKDYIKYKYIINGDNTTTNLPDWKRVSVFIGHELFINNLSIVSQLGYYIYSPSIIEDTIYERIGVKHYFKNSYFASISLKAHLINAESLEFGIGYRF